MTEDNKLRNSDQEIARADQAIKAAKALAGLGLASDSVSRAYYAALHAARALLFARGLEAKSHSGVLHLLNAEFIRQGLLPTSHNRMLAQLQRSRELADYDAAVIFSTEDAEEECKAAERFIDDIKHLLSKI